MCGISGSLGWGHRVKSVFSKGQITTMLFAAWRRGEHNLPEFPKVDGFTVETQDK
jgi:hypothetical protein